MKGRLYLITCPEGKHYVGKTYGKIEARWKEHVRDSSRYNRPLSLAIRKFGADAFIIKEIAEYEESDLEIAEIAAIEKYRSYTDGYNATLGGEGSRKLDINLILEEYSVVKSVRKTAENLNIDTKSVMKILKSLGIDSDPRGHSKSKSVKIVELDLTFDTTKNCAQYLVDNGYATCKVESARSSVGKALSGKSKTYLGFTYTEG